ncbi:MAG: hypothetical protein K8F91_24665, partial [Candidatus Obscuribacterales bacterium]|nr:hypothetical protein [Candidatus Obscuribacterales bacterium]
VKNVLMLSGFDANSFKHVQSWQGKQINNQSEVLIEAKVPTGQAPQTGTKASNGTAQESACCQDKNKDEEIEFIRSF